MESGTWRWERAPKPYGESRAQTHFKIKYNKWKTNT